MIDGGIGGRRAGSTTPASRTARPTRRGGRIFIKALRAIKPGEELFYDYGLIIEGPHPKLKKQFACRCGSRKCRGTMLAPKGK